MTIDEKLKAFFEEYLVGRLRAAHIVCGHDYRFGFHGEGTAALLQAACIARGIGCEIVPQVTLDGVRVSSTVIREQLERGETPDKMVCVPEQLFTAGQITEELLESRVY